MIPVVIIIDLGAGEEIAHIVSDCRQLIDFPLELGVDGGELFVDRLELLSTCLTLLKSSSLKSLR